MRSPVRRLTTPPVGETRPIAQPRNLSGRRPGGNLHNLVENAIRPTKLGATKNWLFTGNEESGQKCAILHTIVENGRRLGIDPKEYLTDVLTRLPGMQAKDANTLTPANWLKSRSVNPVRMAA